MRKLSRLDVVRGSGNVFQDLDFADADIYHAKAMLAAQIIGLLDDRELSVRKAHQLTGFAAADFSRIRNADLGRFSLERLIKMISSLDENAEITIEIRSRKSRATKTPAALSRARGL